MFAEHRGSLEVDNDDISMPPQGSVNRNVNKKKKKKPLNFLVQVSFSRWLPNCPSLAQKTQSNL